MRPRPISAVKCSKHALEQISGKIEDKDVFMKALKEANVPQTLRGPLRFDSLGNAVGHDVHPQGREKDGHYSEHGGEDLSGCQPVLDLRRRRSS